MNCKNILKLIITGNFMLSSFIGLNVSANDNLKEENVISDLLYEKMNINDGDLIPVWVVLNNENENVIKSNIEKEIGVSIENYTDSKKFYSNIVPKLEDKVINEYGKVKAYEPIEIIDLTEQS